MTVYSMVNRYRNAFCVILSAIIFGFLSLPAAAEVKPHVIYLRHASSSTDRHTYLDEINGLRSALTGETAEGAASSYLAGSRIPPYSPGSLRFTRISNGRSLVDFINLDRDNRTPIGNSVSLVVRDRDLYVLGFINGPPGRRVFFRMRELRPGSRESAPSTQTWPSTRTVDLPFSYDYPDIERVAGLSRYGQGHDEYDGLQPNSIRISMRTLRRSVVILSEYYETPHDQEADAEVAMSLLRIIIAYFEGMRFHDISNRIHAARLDEGHSWTVDYRAAVITNNWRSLTEFGSRTSLHSSDTDSDSISQRMELRGRRRPSDEPRIWVTSSLQDISNHLQSWGSILAVALTPRWVVPEAGSCSRRQRRDVSPLEAPPLELKGECEKLLLQIGSTFFDRRTGYAVLESAL